MWEFITLVRLLYCHRRCGAIWCIFAIARGLPLDRCRSQQIMFHTINSINRSSSSPIYDTRICLRSGNPRSIAILFNFERLARAAGIIWFPWRLGPKGLPTLYVQRRSCDAHAHTLKLLVAAYLHLELPSIPPLRAGIDCYNSNMTNRNIFRIKASTAL